MQQRNRFFLPPSISPMRIYEAWYFWGLKKWGEAYPLDLLRRIQSVSPSLSPSREGLYSVLNWMEDRGVVASSWNDPFKRSKKYYQLTQKGFVELESHFLLLQEQIREVRAALERVDRRLTQVPPTDSGIINGGIVWNALILSELFLESQISGSEIKDRLTKLLGVPGWNATDAIVYPLLQGLEETGRVKSIWAIANNKKTIRSYFVPLYAADSTRKHLNTLSGQTRQLIRMELNLIHEALSAWQDPPLAIAR